MLYQLSYLGIYIKKMVGVAGFEPAAHWSQTSCATKLRYTPIQIIWRRGWDSNPRSLSESLVFKTSSLNHSDTSPYIKFDIYWLG